MREEVAKVAPTTCRLWNRQCKNVNAEIVVVPKGYKRKTKSIPRTDHYDDKANQSKQRKMME